MHASTMPVARPPDENTPVAFLHGPERSLQLQAQCFLSVRMRLMTITPRASLSELRCPPVRQSLMSRETRKKSEPLGRGAC